MFNFSSSPVWPSDHEFSDLGLLANEPLNWLSDHPNTGKIESPETFEEDFFGPLDTGISEVAGPAAPIDPAESIELDTTRSQALGPSNAPATHPSEKIIAQNMVQPQFSDVWQWLDGAQRPPQPCVHCYKNRLQCLIINTTAANPNPIEACTSCVALFRECSLSRGQKRHASGFETLTPVAGHLHGVPEHQEGHGDVKTVSLDGNAKPQEARHFQRKGARILQRWYDNNQDHPYPTHTEKSALAQQTGFSRKRISIWFANARRRQRLRPHSPGRPGTPIPCPTGSSSLSSTSDLSPIERWQASPPEEEPVSGSVIREIISAMDTEPLPPPVCDRSEGLVNNVLHASDDAFSHSEPGFSYDGGLSATSGSSSSAWSYRSSHDEDTGFSLPHERRRNRRLATRERVKNAGRRYPCTFCLRTFKKKHDWARHERTVHLPHNLWACTPDLRDLRQSFESEKAACRFCGFQNPNNGHWEEHDFQVCAEKPTKERVFSRKDYLWQHLQKFHGCTSSPVTDLNSWRCAETNIKSQCGFCGHLIESWEERTDHLTEHFKSGSSMDQWDGDWGLDSVASSLLRDAVLPCQRTHLGAIS